MKTEDIFTCPKCGSHKLDEVLFAVSQTSSITVIEPNFEESSLALDYGGYSHDGGELSHYSCGECGRLIAKDEKELANFLFGM